MSAEFGAPPPTVPPRLPAPGVYRAVRFRASFLRAIDYVAAGVFAVIIFGLVVSDPGAFGEPAPPVMAWLVRILPSAALAAAICFPVAIRRRRPLAALLLVLAACSVLLGFGGAITRGPFLPLAFVLYLVAATADRNAAVFGLAASLILPVIQAVSLHLDGVGSGNAIAAGLFLIIVWTVGIAVRQRRAYTARLNAQAASQIAAAAVTEERLRIARELHDVVAHSMTVVAVQAGFGEYVFDSQPAKARAALGAIQTVTRDALSDMQRLLGVLRQAETPPSAAADHFQTPDGTTVALHPAAPPPPPDGEPAGAPPLPADAGAASRMGTAPPGEAALGPAALGPAPPRPVPLRPAPGLADLDRLVQATAGAGVQVEVTRTGQVRPIPPGTDLSAFRIVQEAMTNVVKHSGAGTCRVSLGYGDSDLSIEITDPGGCRTGEAPGNGHVAGAGHGSGAGPSIGANHAAALLPEPGAGSATVGSLRPDAGHASGAGPAPAASHVARAGHGIIGMRERVTLCQGDFSAAPLPEGGFRVWARLPLTDGEP